MKSAVYYAVIQAACFIYDYRLACGKDGLGWFPPRGFIANRLKQEACDVLEAVRAASLEVRTARREYLTEKIKTIEGSLTIEEPGVSLRRIAAVCADIACNRALLRRSYKKRT